MEATIQLRPVRALQLDDNRGLVVMPKVSPFPEILHMYRRAVMPDLPTDLVFDDYAMAATVADHLNVRFRHRFLLTRPNFDPWPWRRQYNRIAMAFWNLLDLLFNSQAVRVAVIAIGVSAIAALCGWVLATAMYFIDGYR